MPKGQWGGCLVLSVGGDWTLASLTPALRLLRPLTPVILPQKETLAGPALGVGVEQCAHVPWGGLSFVINTWLPGSALGKGLVCRGNGQCGVKAVCLRVGVLVRTCMSLQGACPCACHNSPCTS